MGNEPPRREPTESPPRWAITLIALGVVGLLVAAALGGGLSWGSTIGSTRWPGIGDGGASLGGTGTCNSPAVPTPSSILIPLAEPRTSVPPKGTLTVTWEYAVVNYSASLAGRSVYLPSVFASFPQAAGGAVSVYFAPLTAHVAGGGWATPTGANRTVASTGGWQFASGGTALLSTQKIAVMANASYGQLTLEFRWRWSVGAPTGGSVTGNWTVPTRASQWPSSVASIFYPAPYVPLLGNNGPTVLIGANATALLGGSVAGRYFFLELENASTGKVFQSQGGTAPTGATTYTASIVMLNYDHYLDPGTYLLHIHDGCGAMLHSLPEKAQFATAATVHVTVTPSSCGSVTVNGTPHASGTSFSIRPSSTPYSFAIPACSGHSFQGWQGGGGVHIVNASSLRVSSDGSFSVTYR